MDPIVSVIIPTYRRPAFLRRAIRSVLEQTFQDFEVLVVENGESDGGKRIVEEFQRTDHRLHYFYEQQSDPCLARNIGIRAAKGKYIALLDDDDEWVQEKLEKQVRLFNEQPDLGLVSCRGWRMNNAGDVVDERPPFKGTPTFASLVKEGCFIFSPSSVVIRRTYLERTGVFDSKYYIANDYDLYLRLAKVCRMEMIQEPLFKYYWHDGSMSKDFRRRVEETIKVLKSLKISSELGVTRRLVDRRIARFYYGLAVEAMDLKDCYEAARCYLAAVLYDPFIGTRVSWSRWNNPIYRLVRPYLALVYCGWASSSMAKLAKNGADARN